MKMLKITRKHSVSSLIRKIELLAMKSGYDTVEIDSLRWNRLTLCIDSIKQHLMDELDLYGRYI